MRFTVAAAALMAGSAVAHDAVITDYTTELITITDCGSTVTDCPAHKTTTQTNVLPLTTSTVYSTRLRTVTSCAPEVTDCPAHSTVLETETFPAYTTVTAGSTGNAGAGPSASQGTGAPDVVVPSAAQNTGAAGPVTTAAPTCPGHVVNAVTRTYTTVLTTVDYVTVDVPCTNPTGTASPSNPIGGNTTTPGVPLPTAGAATLAGSAMFAAVAGVAALILA
ncbi:hypothetical protein E4U41_004767 [Claviceps citrina]|nr:hypothetical protein E4U41_004767 [Claviceps citrina]